MILASLFALPLLLGLVPEGGGDADARVGFVDASFRVDGTVLDAWFRDLDGDGLMELTTVVHSTEHGRRELHVRRFGADGQLSPAPTQVVRVLEDVIAYGYADVRADAGEELFLLTRGGLYGYSLSKEGYRGNIAKIVAGKLLYDVPDPYALPRWKYVIEGDRRATLLVPEIESYSLWASNQQDEYVLALRVEDPKGLEPRSIGHSGPDHERGVTVRIDDDDSSGIFLTPAEQTNRMLSAGRRYPAPALVDVDGDGRTDLLTERDGALHAHLLGPGGVPRGKPRVEELPGYLEREDTDLSLRLCDLDRDGDVDIIASLEADQDGLENSQVDLLVLLNDGKRLLSEKPHQVLRFEAAELRIELTDVDGDGLVDLIVRKFELPTLLQTATGLEFRHSTLLYAGKKRGFERKPSIKDVRVYDADNVQDVIRHRKITHDLSGDGIADQVEVGLFGEISIRRLRRESSFFGGESWKLDADPWKRFEVEGSVMDLVVVDANGDGLGDVLSAGDKRVTVLLSRRGGGR